MSEAGPAASGPVSDYLSVISGASTAASISGSSAQPRQALGNLLAENCQWSGSRPEAWLPAIVREGHGGAFRKESSQALSVDHFNLGEVQISLAGQRVHLLGCFDNAILAIFTYSKELMQEFCRVLLKVLCPGTLPEGTEGHPLLSGDLMLLSMDWMSHTPDII